MENQLIVKKLVMYFPIIPNGIKDYLDNEHVRKLGEE